jgi:23S rRNA (cytidine1920-2'-O)/16S rRNA (cytidine1409-2'-O)-methyltransferase
LGLAVVNVAASPLPGPRGNVEYFLWLARLGGKIGDGKVVGLTGEALLEAIDRAVREGPQ